MKQEKIVCAAVRFYRDDFDEEGVIVAGINHEHCGEIYNSLTSFDEYIECNEGYLTNSGSFVNRYEALELAIKTEQCDEEVADRGYLLPGDLY